jgi:uncharacterized membrane protein YkoI
MDLLHPPRWSIERRHRRRARSPWRAALLVVVGTLLASPGWADRKGDHDRARAAVQAGEVMPLPDVLARLQGSHPGQVLELELEREDGRWIYEVKLLQGDGRLLRLELDARTAQVLRERRKGGR